MTQAVSETSEKTLGAGVHSTRAWQLAALNAVASLFLLISFARNGVDTTTAEGCVRQLLDFHVFWTAGALALEGTPLAAFDYAVLDARYNVCGEAWMPWLHPPPVMALMMPFGAFGLVPAWALFNLFSVVTLAIALRPFTQGISPVWLAMILAPAYLPAMMAGQFTLLWLAGLLGALAALRAERWVLAGVLIGCLTIKPPLGVLIPFALLAIGAWRTIIAATVTTIALHGVFTFVFGGLDYWTGLLANYDDLTASAVAALGEVNAMTSISSVLTHLGVSEDLAVQANLAVAAALALTVFITWRRFGPKSDIACAVLTASIPLATPYLWHYDSAFLALTGLFLARHLNFAPGPAMTLLIVACWFGAGFSLWIAASTLPVDLPPVLTVPPILLLAFAASLYHSAINPREGR